MEGIERIEMEPESKRISEITELGILCYNIVVNNDRLPQPLVEKANQLGQMMKSGEASPDDINGAILEIGCICYNLYIDKRLDREDIIGKCMYIEQLNDEIKNAADAELAAEEMPQGGPEFDNMTEIDPAWGEAGAFVPEPDIPFQAGADINPSEFKINQPYGMEPIPNEYKRCKCGYRNRAYANFCGKCGAPLKPGRRK